MVFVAFEVFKVAAAGFNTMKVLDLLNKDLTPSEFFSEHKILVKKQNEFNQLVNYPIWMIALFVTIITGFGSAGILMYHFITALAKGQL
jgi:hypothetical protein